MVVVVVVVIYTVAPFKTKIGDCREENRGLFGDKSTISGRSPGDGSRQERGSCATTIAV